MRLWLKVLAAERSSRHRARCLSGHLTFSRSRQDWPRMMSDIPAQFPGVTAVTKANIYFEGRVVSHSILFPDGSRKTLGLIHPGKFHFGTDQAERMEIVAGACTVKIDGQPNTTRHAAGAMFEVPAKSGFDVEVQQGLCEYICSFLG